MKQMENQKHSNPINESDKMKADSIHDNNIESCSEEEHENQEINISIKDTKDNNSSNEPDNQKTEYVKTKKILFLSTFKTLFGKEVTWTAIAALCASTIVIWNIIKYGFLIISSYMLYVITKVPLYILMMRKNIDYTDFYLFYLTVIIIITIVVSLRSIDKKYSDAYTNISFKLALIIFILFFIMILFFYFGFYKDYQILIFTFRYVVPLFLPFIVPIRVILISFINKCKKYIVKFKRLILTPFKNTVNQSEYKSEFFTKESEPICFAMDMGGIIFLLLFISILLSIPKIGLIDQDNRYVVADLGERLIVQDAVYDQNNHILQINNDTYSIIDNCDELIKTIPIILFIAENEN